jgi:hypothetical protein
VIKFSIAIYDKGYHTGSKFNYANWIVINVLLPISCVSTHAP